MHYEAYKKLSHWILYPIKLPHLAFRTTPSIFLWYSLLFHLTPGFLSTASRHHRSSFHELIMPGLPLRVFDRFTISAKLIAEWFLTLSLFPFTISFVSFIVIFSYHKHCRFKRGIFYHRAFLTLQSRL